MEDIKSLGPDKLIKKKSETIRPDEKKIEKKFENNSEKSELEKVCDDLFDYAINRDDIRFLMDRLPENADVKASAVEYELQILKIISVGWCIPYFLELSPHKDRLSKLYWNAINEFSKELSTTTEYMTGQNIDYFEILKKRLETYIRAMDDNVNAPEPAVVVGPEFAKLCGNANDVFTVMTGSRLFIATVAAIKEYLEKIKLR